jgi:hypothetical protein
MIKESTESEDFLATVVSPVPRPSNKDRDGSEESGTRSAGQDVQTGRIPKKDDLWPELATNSSRVPAQSPFAATPAATGPQMRASDVSWPSAGWFLPGDSRWPELLQEPPAAVGEWEEAIRSQERTSRLDREQQGGA